MEHPIGPEKVLKGLDLTDPSLVLVCCGGDGTVGWLLGALDKIAELDGKTYPKVAIIPLGTGNDMSRVLNWGPGYGGDPIGPILQKIQNSHKTIKLDRWRLLSEDVSPGSLHVPVTVKGVDEDDEDWVLMDTRNPSDDSDSNIEETDKVEDLNIEKADLDESQVLNTVDMVVNNYFSIGIDSKVCLDFHQMRTQKPDLFKNKWVNMAWYGGFGLKAMVQKYNSLQTCMVLHVDGKIVDIPQIVMSVIFLNIPSYAAGTNPWGPPTRKTTTYQNPIPQSVCDRHIEVIGVKGAAHVGRIIAGLSQGIRLAQGTDVKIDLLIPLHAQVDGEPFLLPSCRLHFKHHNQAQMLYNETEDPTGTGFDKLSGLYV
eukprot:TRINITY_DN4397_c0_g1_i1.p1 TRINITY_DN4397_c0_g1~~TRINITY_DN4397_c0_g1_i1.p1  ORF type:complete len:369 (-),score=52.73 TRINITY_DN4397_c0_g1_i1:420-1526(-)